MAAAAVLDVLVWTVHDHPHDTAHARVDIDLGRLQSRSARHQRQITASLVRAAKTALDGAWNRGSGRSCPASAAALHAQLDPAAGQEKPAAGAAQRRQQLLQRHAADVGDHAAYASW